MKKIKINKKIRIITSISLGSFLVSGLVAVGVACNSNQNQNNTINNNSNNIIQSSNQEAYVRNADYNFGVAIDAINSLNYIKFTSLKKIIPSLVEGLIKSGPTSKSTLGTLIGVDSLLSKSFSTFSNAKYFEDISDKEFYSQNLSSSYYDLSSFGFLPATLSNYVNDDYLPIANYVNKNSRIIATKFGLNNGASKWSDGKEVNAQDFIDAFEYILDINTGSQLRTQLLDFNIKGSNAMNEAQENYIRVHGKPYINPFGRRPYIYDEKTKEWKEDLDFVPFANQTFDDNNKPIDTNEVNAIKNAALSMGYSTGQMYLGISNQDLKTALSDEVNKDFDFENEIVKIKVLNQQTNEYNEQTIVKNRYFNKRQLLSYKIDNTGALVNEPKISDLKDKNELFAFKNLPRSEYELLIEFEQFAPKANVAAYLNQLLSSQFLLPVNRKFIETNGGISQFGTSKEKFVTSSAFEIDQLELGPGGFMYLNRNKNHYSNHQTLSDRIKVFFNSNNEVKSVWFQEGIISATNVPSSYQLRFWANEKTRKLMKKTQGVGTVAIQFNLDPQSKFSSKEEYENNKDKLDIPLLDANLRKALMYATDRESILRLTGWSASFPVSTWTAFGSLKDSRGKNLELWFDQESIQSEFRDEKTNEYRSFPLQNNSFQEHNGKNYTFENIDRTDKSYDLSVANYYLNLYKKQNPNKDKVVLKFVYPSEPKESTKAAVAFQDLIKRAFNDYVVIDLQALPPNTYSTFIATGKFDISYQNFDKYASSSDYSASMMPFFIEDEIDLETKKTEGFNLNPTGKWTFAEFFKKYDTNEKLEPVLKRLNISAEDIKIIRELAVKDNAKTGEFYNPNNYDLRIKGKELEELDKPIPLFDFAISNHEINEFKTLKQTLDNELINQEEKENVKQQIQKLDYKEIYLNKKLVDSYLEKNKDLYIKVRSHLYDTTHILKLKRINEVVNLEQIKKYYKSNAEIIWNSGHEKVAFSFEYLDNLKADTYSIIEVLYNSSENDEVVYTPITNEYVQIDFDNKKINSNEVEKEIFMTRIETKDEQRQRVRRFFSSARAGWENEESIFRTIANLEKILREEAPILPIMDTDTNWTISSLGGIDSTFTLDLQFAYDYNRPPRNNLPTSPEDSGN